MLILDEKSDDQMPYESILIHDFKKVFLHFEIAENLQIPNLLQKYVDLNNCQMSISIK